METKKYIVQNLGTPCEIVFPRVVEKGKVILQGRGNMLVKNGDEIELLPEQAEKLLRCGYLKEIKTKKEGK